MQEAAAIIDAYNSSQEKDDKIDEKEADEGWANLSLFAAQHNLTGKIPETKP